VCSRRRSISAGDDAGVQTAFQEAKLELRVRPHVTSELGIASDKRRALDAQADYDALFDEYERDSLPTQGAAIGRIADWVTHGERVALTCYEALPQQCHRHCVAEAVERHTGYTITARNL